MPIEQVTRSVFIDDLAVCISAWRWICDDCGRRDTFPDVPMPEGCSEFEPQKMGWVIRWDCNGELCRCPNCKAAATAITGRASDGHRYAPAEAAKEPGTALRKAELGIGSNA